MYISWHNLIHFFTASGTSLNMKTQIFKYFKSTSNMYGIVTNPLKIFCVYKKDIYMSKNECLSIGYLNIHHKAYELMS